MSSPNVIKYEGRNIVYERFNHGWRAIVFGTGGPIGISPELQKAIEADQAHQKQKRESK